MADDKEMTEQEQNDIEQSAGIMADTAQGIARTGKHIADKVHESQKSDDKIRIEDDRRKNNAKYEPSPDASKTKEGSPLENKSEVLDNSQTWNAPKSSNDKQTAITSDPSNSSHHSNSASNAELTQTKLPNSQQRAEDSGSPNILYSSGQSQPPDSDNVKNAEQNPEISWPSNDSQFANKLNAADKEKSPSTDGLQSAERPQTSEIRTNNGNGFEKTDASKKSGSGRTEGNPSSFGKTNRNIKGEGPKPQQHRMGPEQKSLTGNTAKNAGRKTGRAVRSSVRRSAQKIINQIRDMFRKLVLFLAPYLLAIFLVAFIIIILVFVAYTIAYRYKGSSSGGGNYSYNWIVKESGSLDEEEKQNNAVIIYGKLKDEGWSLNAIAAAIGNWDWESGLNPARWEGDQIGNTSGGYGLAQWTPATKILNWLSENGYEKDSGDGQLQWIIENTTSDWIASNNMAHMSGESFIHSTEDAATLARYYCQSFERGAWTDTRASNASKWYEWLKDNGDSALAKLKTSSTGTHHITIADIQSCKSKQEYLDLVMPCYQDYCKQFGIKYPGILALQVYYEVGSGFPQQLSNVAIKDNNLGGLKYSSGIPGATSGTSAPANEGSSAYCHFDSVGDYFYAQCWQIGQPLYASARNHQGSAEEFARALCNIWIAGRNGTGPYGYSENLIRDYKTYNLSKWEG